MNNSTSAIVTGSSGFIGSNLVAYLLRNNIKTLGIDPFEPEIENDLFENHLGYVDTLPDEMVNKFFNRDTTLFHIGAKKHRSEHTNTEEIINANVNDFYRLLNLVKLKPVKKIIFTSSLYVYGTKNSPPFSEETPTAPETIYGITKLLGEKLLEKFSKETGIPSLSLRLFFIYGSNQRTRASNYESVIHKTVKLVKENKSPEIYGSGEQGMDFVHVDDLCQFFIDQLSTHESGYDVLNFSSGTCTTINELVDKIKKICNSNINNDYFDSDWTEGLKRYGTNKKLQNKLKINNLINLDDGLKKSF